MCGIVGYVGPRDCARLLLEGLSRLETADGVLGRLDAETVIDHGA